MLFLKSTRMGLSSEVLVEDFFELFMAPGVALSELRKPPGCARDALCNRPRRANEVNL